MAYGTHSTAPAQAGYAITPSDSTILDPPTRALYIGRGGTVVVRLVGQAGSLTFINVPDGTFLPLACQQVLAATSASNIVGLH